jgi:hypothetical protein
VFHFLLLSLDIVGDIIVLSASKSASCFWIYAGVIYVSLTGCQLFFKKYCLNQSGKSSMNTTLGASVDFGPVIGSLPIITGSHVFQVFLVESTTLCTFVGLSPVCSQKNFLDTTIKFSSSKLKWFLIIST